MIYVQGRTEQEITKFHNATQKGSQFKTYDSHWGIKYHIGKGVAKELTCKTIDMNNGKGIAWGVLGGGAKGKNRNNCNSIINKI